MRTGYRVEALTIGIILLVVCASSVAAGARWVEVKGGSRPARTDELKKIQHAIEPYVRAQAKHQGLTLQRWTSYTFQYRAQKTPQKQFIFVNAFCFSDNRTNLRKEMVLVMDGGTCFFNLKYDPKKGVFYELWFNGMA